MIDTSKVIHAPVGGGRYTVTAPIVKEDYGLYLLIEGLELSETYQVDFSNSEHNGTSVTMIGNSDGVLIPHQFIDTGKDIFAFLYHVGANYGRTVYKFRIPNKVRPDRTEDTPTPEEQSIIDQAISALNSAVEQTAQDVIDADASAQSASDDADRAEEARTDAQNYATQAEQARDYAQTYANNASASATASAQSASQSAQIKADVEELVDDAQASADASERSASNAHTYATSAEQSSVNASASESSAQGYASQAQTSAQSASSKASEASTSASTASAKATESAQSASQAQGYANTAESAKTASQNAQGLAESARDSAISAQESAEDARDEAQSIVDGISGKVEQIDSNTEHIESLEDDRYKPYVVDSASGAIASFPDGADDIPLKSLIVNIDPVQSGTGDPSPDNVRPISGWTGMQLQKTRANILNPSANPIWNWSNVYTLNQDGSVTQSSNDGRGWTSNTFTGLFLKKGQYTLSFTAPNITCNLRTSIDDYTESYRTTKSVLSFTLAEDCTVKWKASTSSYPVTYAVQLEVGTEATAYEPYNGTTLPISWQSEAGTVYGGRLDVLSGVMRVEKAIIDLATLTGWASNMSGQNAIEIRCTLNGKKEGRTNLISDMLKTGTETSATDTAVFSVRGYPTSSTIAVKVPKTVAQDSSEAVAWVRENHPMACYELAEPIEIQLDAHTLNSLYGQNNIFADTGDTSAEYRANTKLYIEKLTQPEEDDMIADSTITSGQFFMIGNVLYRALANIASGATITVGTNAQRVSLADALNLVNA